jgi:hypothetical protein
MNPANITGDESSPSNQFATTDASDAPDAPDPPGPPDPSTPDAHADPRARRKRKGRRRMVIAIALVVFAVLGLNGFAYIHAHAMMTMTRGGAKTSRPEHLSLPGKIKVLFTGVNVPRPVSDLTPAELAPDCRALTIPGPDGVTLGAWYVDRGEPTPLVILFHGYAVEKTKLLPEARALLELGTSVMLIDFRGSGASSEAYCTIGMREAEDVAAAVQYARNRTTHRGLVLFGQSMGAAATLRAIAIHNVRPDAVIIEGVFDRMLHTIANRFHLMGLPAFPCAHLLVFWGGRQQGFDGFTHNPSDYARSLSCPALFMHGDSDTSATPAEARRVFENAAGPKTVVEFKDTGHEPYIARHPEAWNAAVENLLKQVEAGAATRS